VAFVLGHDTGNHSHRVCNEFVLTWPRDAQFSVDVLVSVDGGLRSSHYLLRGISLSPMRKAVFLVMVSGSQSLSVKMCPLRSAKMVSERVTPQTEPVPKSVAQPRDSCQRNLGAWLRIDLCGESLIAMGN